MTLDPENRALVESARQNAAKPRHELTPEEARAVLTGLGKLLPKGADMARREIHSIPVDGGEIELRLLVPHGELLGAMVYFHGGGWVIGSNDQFEPMCRELAAKSGIAIGMVCYRKAPEYRFPIPLEDAWTGFNWMLKNAERLLEQRLPLYVGGDSAGANLAAAIALRQQKAGPDTLAGQLLVYPVLEADFDKPSYTDPENQTMLTREVMIGYWDYYIPDAAHRDIPDAAPLKATDLSGLPPAVIITAEHDVLRDEGEAYANCLRAAGVPVTHRRFDGQIHAFMMMLSILPQAEAAIDFAADALQTFARTST